MGEIRFDDGAAYERMMGTWSRIAGSRFLDWLAPPASLRWADVGCGNGAFTELVVQGCAPAAVVGIDPSDAQLAFARTRPGTPGVTYLQGDAMRLPLEDASFDAAVMALVLFFVPDPARGVAEMARITRPGGCIAAYSWDIAGGGLPHAPIGREMRAMGFPAPLPPSADCVHPDRLRALWNEAGLTEIEVTAIEAPRTFESFEAAWETCTLSAALRETMLEQPPEVQAELKERVRGRVAVDAQGHVTLTGRANAVKGRKG